MYYLTGILGFASVAAPFLFSYGNDSTAMWTSIGIGTVLILASAFEWAAKGNQAWEYWVAGIAGLTAVMAPFVLGFNASGIGYWTLVMIGFVTMGVAGAKLFPGRTDS